MRKLIVAVLVVVAFGVQAQTYDSLPNAPEYYNQRSAKFRKEKTSTSNPVLFLGNSITEGGNWRRLLKDSSVLNRGISGDVTFGVMKRLDEVTRHKPSKIFLLIGVNDLSRNTPNAVIIQNIFSIVHTLHAQSPSTQIYVQSILPVNPGHKNFPSRFDKQPSIDEINGQLSKYHEALKYTYLDVQSVFQDELGKLNLKYTTDGLHLNRAGYMHWLEYLKKQKCL